MAQQRYNIALLPEVSGLRDNIIRISRKYFLDIQDEYILGPEGLPHITLCQFKADNLEQAVNVYNELLSREKIDSIKPTIEKFNTRPGKLVNVGKFIAEYKIKPAPDLVNLQLRCADRLSSYKLKKRTPSEGYSPHITLARLSSAPDRIPTKQDLNCPVDFSVRLSLGLSTESGVFVKELCK